MNVKVIPFCVTIALSVSALRVAPTLAEEKILEDDFSRAELGAFAVNSFDRDRALPFFFKFPTDVPPGGIYGIDVSHYQGRIDWGAIAKHRITFAYIKASQGAGFRDSQFARNWKELSKANNTAIRRGAYHFFSSADDGAAQAANFLRIVGPLRTGDLPPCLDLEWDFVRKDGRPVLDSAGRPIDGWAKFPKEEIVQRALAWLTTS